LPSPPDVASNLFGPTLQRGEHWKRALRVRRPRANSPRSSSRLDKSSLPAAAVEQPAPEGALVSGKCRGPGPCARFALECEEAPSSPCRTMVQLAPRLRWNWAKGGWITPFFSRCFDVFITNLSLVCHASEGNNNEILVTSQRIWSVYPKTFGDLSAKRL